MLTVTRIAKEKLKEALQEKTIESGFLFRIVLSPSPTERVGISLDTEREGDQVVESEDGTKVLLIGPDVAAEMEGLVFDYKETPVGAGFTLSRPPPAT